LQTSLRHRLPNMELSNLRRRPMASDPRKAARVLSICEFADVALRHYDFEKAGRNITYLCQRQSSSGS
jgi:hypothetical protein